MVIFFFFIFTINGVHLPVDANCTFPANLGGVWISATRGELLFNSTSIRNYRTSTNLGGIFNFNCVIQDANLYFLRAEEFINVFGRITRFYLCLEITEVNRDLMYYYVATEFDKFADDYIFGESENHDNVAEIMLEACSVPQPYVTGTYVTLVKKDSISNFNYTCPVPLFHTFSNLTITGTRGVSVSGTGSCQGSHVDVCTDRRIIQVNNNCSSPRTLSSSGTYNCLHWLTSDGVTFLSVWNNDVDPDEQNTFQFSCIAYRKHGGVVYATETPQTCTNTTNSTYTEKGLSFLFYSIKETCLDIVTVPTTTPGPPPDLSFLYYLLIIPAVLLLVWFILLIILLLRLCWGWCRKLVRKRREKKEINKTHGDLVEKKKFSARKLRPLLPKIHSESMLFKPKRPIDISSLFTSVESGSFPTITPMSKLSPLYHDSITDYMHGKMARRPSGHSVYSFGSITFDSLGFVHSRALTTSSLVSESSSPTTEVTSEMNASTTPSDSESELNES